MTPTRKPLHVLIAGAGVAALEAALALQALAEEKVSVELIAPETEFTYRPLAGGPEIMRTHLRDEFELLKRIEALDEGGCAGTWHAITAFRQPMSSSPSTRI